jgi:hypothetical protein
MRLANLSIANKIMSHSLDFAVTLSIAEYVECSITFPV